MSFDVVVLVPGICGSVLKEGDRVIWPGTAWNVVFKSYPDEDVATLANSESVVASDILRGVPLNVAGVTLHWFDGYGRALATLEQFGFREANKTLIPFAYDWRRDIRVSAQRLKDRLAESDLAGRNVAIVAHSMGGLVTRYLLEKLGIPDSVRVSLAVLAAVPHLGAPVVLQNMLGHRPELFLSESQCKTALRNPAFPSAYQLLPARTVPVFLTRSPAFGFLTKDIISNDVVTGLNLLPAGLDAAHGLDPISPGFEPPGKYVAIAGNAQETVTANYFEVKNGNADAVPLTESTAGDGTVPLWSAAPAGIPVRYVASEHGSILADATTRALLEAVLCPGKPGVRPFAVNEPAGPLVLTAQSLKPSVTTGQSVTVSLVANRATNMIEATLVVDTMFGNGRTDQKKFPIRCMGGAVRSMSVELKAPDVPAVMRCAVGPAGANMITGEPDATILVLPP